MSEVPVETIADLIVFRERTAPEATAFRFLDADARVVGTISYAELARAARRAAHVLLAAGARKQRVLIATAPGRRYLEWFAGCVLADAVAVPALPPTSRHKQRRMSGLIRNATAGFVVGASRHSARLTEGAGPEDVRWIDEDAHLGVEPLSDLPVCSPGGTAFLQYTSGSTSEPRGVVVPHTAILQNVRQIATAFAVNSGDQGFSWLPPYHDMGLIGGLLTPLYVGFPMGLMDPADFGRNPLAWLKAISALRATVSGGPNAAFDACARELERAGAGTDALDLSQWSVAFTGAEPVRKETMDRFASAAAPYGFRPSAFHPCYGLAEATLLVSCAPRRVSVASTVQAIAEAGQPAQSFVSCGRPAGGVEVRIVDGASGGSLPAGTVGEIWVRGSAVAAGYWQAPAETRDVFEARTAEGDGPFLRTGDLGFLDAAGELVPAGRSKDLMVVRGRNIYPQDVESAARSAADGERLGLAAAFHIDADDQLAVLVECAAPQERWSELLQDMRTAVMAECEVLPHVVALVRVGTLPRTSSGKVQRSAARAEFLAGQSRVTAVLDRPASDGAGHARARQLHSEAGATTDRRRLVLEYLRARLEEEGARLKPQDDQPVMSLGLDSMALAGLLDELEILAGCRLPRAAALATDSISALAALVDTEWTQSESASTPVAAPPGAGERGGRPDTPTGHGHWRPLTPGQQQMWLAEARAPGSTNIWTAMETDSFPAVEEFESALRRVCTRHDALRTTYQEQNGVVRQRVVPAGSQPVLNQVDGTGWTDDELRDWLHRTADQPVDLEQAPVLRAWLVFRSATRRVLLLVLPHLAVDAYSMYLLVADLVQLPGLRWDEDPASFHSHLEGVADYLGGAGGDRAREHWERVLDTAQSHLALPRRRPVGRLAMTASEVDFHLSAELLERLDALAGRERATRFTALLSVYAVLLHRRTGQSTVTIGVPMAGRQDTSHAGIVGMLMNPVPIVVRVTRETTFTDLLRAVQRQLLQAMEHQSFPLAALPESTGRATAEQWPWFETSFTLHRVPGGLPREMDLFELVAGVRIGAGEGNWRSVRVPRAKETLPLALVAGAAEDGVHFVLRYLDELFDRRTVLDLADTFPQVVEQLTAEPDRPGLSTVGTAAAAPQPAAGDPAGWPAGRESRLSVVDRLASVAARYGDRIAIDDEALQLTYRELWDRVVAGATELSRRGVAPGDRVALLHARDGRAVVATFSVLAAGAAYVHLDAGSPIQRLRGMLASGGVELLLTCERELSRARELGVPLLATEDLMDAPSGVLRSWPSPSSAAYVSYTSGSSGAPKGVVVSHRAAVCAADAFAAPLALGPGDVLCTISPFGWDISSADICGALLRGATMCVAKEEHETDGTALAALLKAHQVTLLQTTPARWRILLDSGWTPPPGFRAVCGGDSLDPALADRFDGLGVHAWNYYGPTETTFWSTASELRERSPGGPVSIGRPLADYEAFVLTEDGSPVPDGTVGELYIGGGAVADGYLGNPRLTAERFVPDPLSGRPGARLYRTGDRVRRQEPHGLFHLGRADTQIKLRGYRLEIAEVEEAAAAHPAVEFAAAGLVNEPDGPELALYLIPRSGRSIDLREVNRDIATRLPRYMIPTRFAVLERLPLNVNGKLDRAALAMAPVKSVGASREGRTLTSQEKSVAEVFRAVLVLDEVDVEDDFFLVGGHSLRAMEVASRLSAATGRSVSVRAVFEHPTVASLARWLTESLSSTTGSSPGDGAGEAGRPDGPTADAPTPGGATTAGQRRMWLAHQLGLDHNGLVLPFLVELTGQVRMDALQQAFDALVDRHESLRTVFLAERGEPSQRSGPWPDFSETVEGGTRPDRIRQARGRLQDLVDRPWSLATGPLLRCEVLRSPDSDHVVLALAVHHAIFDGWSGRVLLAEFMALYEGIERVGSARLPVLGTGPAAAAARQRAREREALRAGDAAYFAAELADAPSFVLPAPTDPASVPADGAHCVSAGLGRSLHELARKLGTTPAVVAAAALLAVLRRRTGQDDIVLGFDVANRQEPELAGLIGYFGNQVAIRARLAEVSGFAGTVGHLRRLVGEALAYAQAPYEDVVAEVRARRPDADGALFTVKLVHQFIARSGRVGDRAEFALLDTGIASAADPLGLWIWDDGETANLQIHYRVQQCDGAWAESVLREVVALLDNHEENEHAMEDGMPDDRDFATDEEGLPSFEDMVVAPISTGLRTAVEAAGGTRVLVVEGHGGRLSAAEWLTQNRDVWRTGLAEHGALLMRGFDVSTPAALAATTDFVFAAPYATTEHPRALVEGRVVSPVDYPASKELYWHNEDSFNHLWPATLAFSCAVPPASGGETTVVDGAVAYQGLERAARDRFEEHGVCYVRRYHPGIGLPWQTVFGTEDRNEVERQCQAKGMEFAWEDGVLTTLARRPAVLPDDRHGPLWFAQILHWHVSCLDDRMRRDLAKLFGERMPRSCTYGDGTTIPDEVVEQLVITSRRNEYAVRWQRGDLLLVDNRRAAHGRRSYEGPRGILVALGDPTTDGEIFR
ncbi:amino acid adenylation domain-containing protein [Kitasatospora griseola]|uniref:amino acid adenylation domain-containing protein n=1 Tax=Kitasatospora griseola TaxID=2064 RepID=UPI0034241833